MSNRRQFLLGSTALGLPMALPKQAVKPTDYVYDWRQSVHNDPRLPQGIMPFTHSHMITVIGYERVDEVDPGGTMDLSHLKIYRIESGVNGRVFYYPTDEHGHIMSSGGCLISDVMQFKLVTVEIREV